MRYCSLAAILLSWLLACASTKGTNSPGQSPNALTAAEISASTARNAFEAVDLLRPQWLRTRGGSYLPVVYLDNTKYGEIDALRNIPAANVAEMQYMSSSDATTRFGTGHVGGAILVKTK